MRNPHVIAIPFPSQGHVNPLMHFCQKLSKNNVKVTFVNTDFIHNKVITTLGDQKRDILSSQIELVSVPDGFDPYEERYSVDKVFVRMMKTLRSEFEKLFVKEFDKDKDNVFVLVDMIMAWVLEVAHDLGIRGVIFSSFSAAYCAMNFSIPKFLEDGILDAQGIPTKEQKIKLRPGLPLMDTANFPWRCLNYNDEDMRKLFEYLLKLEQGFELTNWFLINTAHDLEPEAVSMTPKILSIGPLAASQAGQFLKEDESCLDWLDQQPPCSVLYLAFGSSTHFDSVKFRELALGLELTGLAFLWVVRPGTEHEFPDGFDGSRGKIISWAPQQKVLSHPALACFVSHCGWSSTLEGLSSGVPFLCWPFLGDQFLNKSYLCDIWKVGIGLDMDENDIVSRGEIRNKVEELLGNGSIRARCVELKKKIRKSVEPGGQSLNNFEKFIEWMRGKEEAS